MDLVQSVEICDYHNIVVFKQNPMVLNYVLKLETNTVYSFNFQTVDMDLPLGEISYL